MQKMKQLKDLNLMDRFLFAEAMEDQTSRECNSERIRLMQERIKGIKASEEVGVRYMQEWEERELDRRKAREEGIEQGIEKGIEQGIEQGICAFVETLRELGVSRRDTEIRLAEKFGVDSARSEQYMEKYWKI